MATYKEVFDEGMMKAGVVTPLAWLTPGRGLLWISQIINKYQTKVGVKKCSETIFLDVNSTDGRYSLGYSPAPNGVNEITLNPLGSQSQQYQPIYRYPLDSFHQLIQNWPDNTFISDPTNLYPDVYIDTSQVYCAIQECKLIIFPYNTGGIVTIRYKPALPAYMPSDTANWARFGSNPYPAMQGTSIPEEFLPAIEGITSYVARKIVENTPNGVRDWAMQYAAWGVDVQEGYALLRRGNVDYMMDTKQPTSLGPVF